MTPAKKSNLRSPFLKRLWLDPDRIKDQDVYPFSLPLFHQEFEIVFEQPISILVGENGSGKSTILEGIAGLAGYDEAGGGKGYRPVDHTRAVEMMGGRLSAGLKASWLPKITDGWFFRAESFFSVARYLDEAALDVGAPPPDFLSHSHGEGFLRFFQERTRQRGIYIFDEPESALSPLRQLKFMKILQRMTSSGMAQVIMATHSPLLMAFPGAQILELSNHRVDSVRFSDVQHFKILGEFYKDPRRFIQTVLDE